MGGHKLTAFQGIYHHALFRTRTLYADSNYDRLSGKKERGIDPYDGSEHSFKDTTNYLAEDLNFHSASRLALRQFCDTNFQRTTFGISRVA
jgi:hypothetical protein